MKYYLINLIILLCFFSGCDTKQENKTNYNKSSNYRYAKFPNVPSEVIEENIKSNKTISNPFLSFRFGDSFNSVNQKISSLLYNGKLGITDIFGYDSDYYTYDNKNVVYDLFFFRKYFTRNFFYYLRFY